ncbi:cysteine synthase A [Thermosipho atlanticus]|uniref:Cysteine synthase n=1 Tax=Thermosipho atlanticus DSM 15807 TaxID=1123380 RepID=A0A1M5TZE7_9BACT|nr:cysteine synthase A [Thermosipho atlanticus]SHH56167.1 cysteine synthase [Thermosipho atlanticus DSM 15807]
MVGNTPIVFIEKLGIYAKLERNNPGGSVKDRPAFFMINAAIRDGKLTNKILVEPTSGNTGIALAWLGKKLGINVILTMPETMTKERIDIMKAFGADIVLTPGEKGMKGAIEKALEIVESKSAYMPNQFENINNVISHELTTGPEILSQMNFNLDAFVAGVGTGGTITGVGHVLRKYFNNNVKIVAVEPSNSPVLSGGNPGKHKIQGIGAGFIPKILDLAVIDEVFTVSDEEAFHMFKYINNQLGISVGISSAANAYAAIKIKEKYNLSRVLTVFPDDNSKYLSLI